MNQFSNAAMLVPTTGRIACRNQCWSQHVFDSYCSSFILKARRRFNLLGASESPFRTSLRASRACSSISLQLHQPHLAPSLHRYHVVCYILWGDILAGGVSHTGLAGRPRRISVDYYCDAVQPQRQRHHHAICFAVGFIMDDDMNDGSRPMSWTAAAKVLLEWRIRRG